MIRWTQQHDADYLELNWLYQLFLSDVKLHCYIPEATSDAYFTEMCACRLTSALPHCVMICSMLNLITLFSMQISQLMASLLLKAQA